MPGAGYGLSRASSGVSGHSKSRTNRSAIAAGARNSGRQCTRYLSVDAVIPRPLRLLLSKAGIRLNYHTCSVSIAWQGAYGQRLTNRQAAVALSKWAQADDKTIAILLQASILIRRTAVQSMG
jgi:hypothetical protein